MKKIIYTQRVEIVESYGERRDCADQKIPEFIKECGYLPIPISNLSELVPLYFDIIKPDGVMLTGGNSLVSQGGNAPEKDATDENIIRYALKNKIPIYGFCRGMQSILDYFGYDLVPVSNHVAVVHNLYGEYEGMQVNSYHNQGIKEVKEPFQVLAYTEDGVIEAIQSTEYKIIGTMWHPEREQPFSQKDIERVKKLYG